MEFPNIIAFRFVFLFSFIIPTARAWLSSSVQFKLSQGWSCRIALAALLILPVSIFHFTLLIFFPGIIDVTVSFPYDPIWPVVPWRMLIRIWT